MSEQDVLHMPFDIERHKETFTNYLEVVIRQDGTVQYAVPSHTEKMVLVLRAQMGLDRRGVMDACPRDFYGAYLEWLALKSGCIPVWNTFYVGLPSPAQMETLKALRDAGLYGGHIKEGAHDFAMYGGGFRAPTERELEIAEEGRKEREMNPNGTEEAADTWFCD